ncbi:hypothetical protein AB9G23_07560 [Francisella philomiragia]|uniref:hypothetical protein n=1 Tax=Francisella philomiragia TaxID=28110 RepID=UPI0019043B30|nr:hypothetical protein [Francisella philomiragia]MBK2024769.1 hypothetical protein [Francisella philomiragia]
MIRKLLISIVFLLLITHSFANADVDNILDKLRNSDKNIKITSSIIYKNNLYGLIQTKSKLVYIYNDKGLVDEIIFIDEYYDFVYNSVNNIENKKPEYIYLISIGANSLKKFKNILNEYILRETKTVKSTGVIEAEFFVNYKGSFNRKNIQKYDMDTRLYYKPHQRMYLLIDVPLFVNGKISKKKSTLLIPKVTAVEIVNNLS